MIHHIDLFEIFTMKNLSGARKQNVDIALFDNIFNLDPPPPIGQGIHGTVRHKSHERCFNVFLMEAGVMSFVTLCTHVAAINYSITYDESSWNSS